MARTTAMAGARSVSAVWGARNVPPAIATRATSLATVTSVPLILPAPESLRVEILGGRTFTRPRTMAATMTMATLVAGIPGAGMSAKAIAETTEARDIVGNSHAGVSERLAAANIRATAMGHPTASVPA